MKIHFYKEPEGGILAFFPDEPDNHRVNKEIFRCYAQGGHSICHIDYLNECLPATVLESAALKAELKEKGYDLK